MKTRIQVRRFAQTMEQELQFNDHKGGWDHAKDSYLFKCLLEEVSELSDSLLTEHENQYFSHKDIQRECADIANFAMMISNNRRTP